MPNPYKFPAIMPPQIETTLDPRNVTEPFPSLASWSLQREAWSTFVSAQHVLETGFPNFSPRNLERDIESQLRIVPETELLDLDFGQWQQDAYVLLETLGHDSYDSDSLVGNSFKPTDKETRILETSSMHEKKVIKAHEQFIRMLRTHKAKAFAMYDGQFDFHFYRLFQGNKTRAKMNAINNIFQLWSELFYHWLDGKPYQPLGFKVTLHLLFGKLAHQGVRYRLVKDFNYRGGNMRTLEQRWNKQKIVVVFCVSFVVLGNF
jgi:hypothetical protein